MSKTILDVYGIRRPLPYSISSRIHGQSMIGTVKQFDRTLYSWMICRIKNDNDHTGFSMRLCEYLLYSTSFRLRTYARITFKKLFKIYALKSSIFEELRDIE